MDILLDMFQKTGFLQITWGNVLMWIVSMVFLILAIQKGYEPLLLVPISFGILLANIPLAEFMKEIQSDLYNPSMRTMHQEGEITWKTL